MKRLKARSQPQNSKTQDHFKKPQSNTEILEEHARHISQLYKIIGDLNSRLICLSMAKSSPEILAKFMLDQPAQTKFMDDFNAAVDKEIESLNAISKETKDTIGAHSKM